MKLTSASSIHNGPSASADIIGTVYSGAEVRVASRNSEWVQIVDPSSGRTGWIDSTVLSPLTLSLDTASTEDFTVKPKSKDEPTAAVNEPPLEQGVEIPEEDASAMIKSTPGAKKEAFIEASLWPQTVRGQVQVEALLPKVAFNPMG